MSKIKIKGILVSMVISLVLCAGVQAQGGMETRDTRIGNLVFENGYPDHEWSMRGNNGVVELGEFEAVFQYVPPMDPDLIRLAVTTKKKSGTREATRQLHADFHLRNHKYQ